MDLGEMIDQSAELANILKPEFLYSTIKYDKRFLLEALKFIKAKGSKYYTAAPKDNMKKKRRKLQKQSKKISLKILQSKCALQRLIRDNKIEAPDDEPHPEG